MSEVRSRSKGKEAQELEQQGSNSGDDGDGKTNYDPSLFDKKVTMAVEGLEPFFDKILRQKTSKENALDTAEYINTAKRNQYFNWL